LSLYVAHVEPLSRCDNRLVADAPSCFMQPTPRSSLRAAADFDVRYDER